MDINIGVHIIEACLFGLVFAALHYLIAGWSGWRPWLAMAVWLAGLAYIILFGIVRV